MWLDTHICELKLILVAFAKIQVMPCIRMHFAKARDILMTKAHWVLPWVWN